MPKIMPQVIRQHKVPVSGCGGIRKVEGGRDEVKVLGQVPESGEAQSHSARDKARGW